VQKEEEEERRCVVYPLLKIVINIVHVHGSIMYGPCLLSLICQWESWSKGSSSPQLKNWSAAASAACSTT
jgi:hypothetical protein